VFRRSAAAFLAERGYEVVGEAGTVADARAALGRLDPDALRLDVNLPDGNGVTFATELREERRRLRIVLTSTDASAVTARLLARCGAAGFVAKPDLMAADLAPYLG
jgi:DNA-binding NarL/FixJ family response regulator